MAWRTISGLILGTVPLLAGCTALGLEPARRSAGDALPAPERTGRGSERADRALVALEKRVARHPEQAAARAALGQAYLRAGRFASALAAFDDALLLGDASAATILGLALAEVALGRPTEAVRVLDEWRDLVPAADRGLALALAGETGRGVELLGEALRAGPVSVRLRQNLAYAYALDGRWREAALMAAQDLPPPELRARIERWAMIGRADAAAQRVAGLLSAPLRSDPGYPAALTLTRPQPTTPETPAELARMADPEPSTAATPPS